jgi:hypothetical protein
MAAPSQSVICGVWTRSEPSTNAPSTDDAQLREIADAGPHWLRVSDRLDAWRDVRRRG